MNRSNYPSSNVFFVSIDLSKNSYQSIYWVPSSSTAISVFLSTSVTCSYDRPTETKAAVICCIFKRPFLLVSSYLNWALS